MHDGDWSGQTIACVISNYPNGCADTRWFGASACVRVVGGWWKEEKEFAESPIDESVWQLVSDALLFQPESRLRWLQWALLLPHERRPAPPTNPSRLLGLPRDIARVSKHLAVVGCETLRRLGLLLWHDSDDQIINLASVPWGAMTKRPAITSHWHLKRLFFLLRRRVYSGCSHYYM